MTSLPQGSNPSLTKDHSESPYTLPLLSSPHRRAAGGVSSLAHSNLCQAFPSGSPTTTNADTAVAAAAASEQKTRLSCAQGGAMWDKLARLGTIHV